MKLFSLKPFLSKIEGKPADKWLEENDEIKVIPRDDGVSVTNICCIDLQVNGKGGEFKFIPMSTTVLSKPDENSMIKINGYLFTLYPAL